MRQKRGRDQTDECWFGDGENGRKKTGGSNVLNLYVRVGVVGYKDYDSHYSYAQLFFFMLLLQPRFLSVVNLPKKTTYNCEFK